jgi:phenylalanyl-tRNA synthetase beta chain
MKLSINWIRSIIASDKSSADIMPKGIDDLVEKIGAQLGAVEEVIDFGKKYQGIVIAKVISCQKHPDADKLKICLIDDGGTVKNVKRDAKGLVQVVCGAPNVEANWMVAWLPPGTTVPSTFDKEPLVLESREIRGQTSNGMLASAKELDLGDDHTGIIMFDPFNYSEGGGQEVPHTDFLKAGKWKQRYKPGDDFAKAFGLDDFVIDIENKMFTHRPDLFGQLGIARELAGIQRMVFRSPKWYLGEKTTGRHKTDDKLLSVKNEIPKLVPRFMMQIKKNVEVKSSSPLYLAALSRVGIRPINNVVDITNYVMMETAQPLHAYDYDKVTALSGSQPSIIVRLANKGEKLKLLGGKEITLNGDEMVIATDKQAIGLAGVMGGAETEVDNKTKNIILECGTFDMNQTRRSAMAHGLFTDASTRFTKGQSPWQNDRALYLAANYLIDEAGGWEARTIYDLKTTLPPLATVVVSPEFINSRLGLALTTSEIKKLLENVEFRVTAKGKDLTVEAPFWRTDIEIPEDVVEEVGRLYGYDHLPQILPMRDVSAAKRNPLFDLKSRIREILRAAGANEVLTYSFVHGTLLEKAGQDYKRAFKIKNALSPDLQYYRLSLGPSLLEKVHPNIRLGFDEFVLFELGQDYAKDKIGADKLPKPVEPVAVIYAASKSDHGAAYFEAKYYLQELLTSLGVTTIDFEPFGISQHKTATYYEPLRSADVMVNGKKIGVIGEFREAVSLALKLPEACAGFELHVEELIEHVSQLGYQTLNRFPATTQDISLRLPDTTNYAAVEHFLHVELGTMAAKHGYNFRLEPVDIYQKSESRKQITMRIILEHPERTLTTAETNKLLDIIAANAKTKLKAERI